MSKNSGLPDYSSYHFKGRERIFYFGQSLLIVAAFSYFFYRSWIAFLLLSPLLFWLMGNRKKELARKRRQELGEQFKDLILSVAANQKAGYSVENAFREAYKDMRLLYGEESMVCEEIRHIVLGLDNNVVLENMLYDLGMRSHHPDLMQFAEVFWIAKRSGGNMTDILQKTAQVIEQKQETDKEIQVMLSARRMEQKIMNLVPFLIISYISMTSTGFFDVLYHNAVGIAIMTVCLVVYVAAYRLSEKIVDIEV